MQSGDEVPTLPPWAVLLVWTCAVASGLYLGITSALWTVEALR